MDDQPVYSPWRKDKIYAGFWIRFAALLLDFIILLPVSLIFVYISSFNRLNCIYIYVFQFIVLIFYHVYLVKKYGGTVGKLAVGIKVIKMNGEKAGWEEATYRYIVSIVFSIISFMITVSSALSISDEQFKSYGVFQRNGELLKENPIYKYYVFIMFLWFLSDTIALLASDRKRSIHDLIGETVVVNNVYLNAIRKDLNKTDSL